MISGIYLTQNAQHFESNTALCKVSTKDSSYIVRWSFFLNSCIKYLFLFNHFLLACLDTQLMNMSLDSIGAVWKGLYWRWMIGWWSNRGWLIHRYESPPYLHSILLSLNLLTLVLSSYDILLLSMVVVFLLIHLESCNWLRTPVCSVQLHSSVYLFP